MELHGSKDLFNCTKAVLVTDGQIIGNAKEVANKLGIEILFIEPDDNFSNNNLDWTIDQFDKIWENYIKPLEGNILTRGNGKSNRILSVDWSGIERITSNGKKQRIKIEVFRLAINKILSDGSITRDYINQEYKDRASSGIVLILSQVPFFDFYDNPSRIVLNEEKYKCI
jgi:restriction system protein